MTTVAHANRENQNPRTANHGAFQTELERKLKNLRKRLRQIDDLKQKIHLGEDLNEDQLAKVAAEDAILAEIRKWQAMTEDDALKRTKNLRKKLRQIDDLELRLAQGESLNEDQTGKVGSKAGTVEELKLLESMLLGTKCE